MLRARIPVVLLALLAIFALHASASAPGEHHGTYVGSTLVLHGDDARCEQGGTGETACSFTGAAGTATLQLSSRDGIPQRFLWAVGRIVEGGFQACASGEATDVASVSLPLGCDVVAFELPLGGVTAGTATVQWTG